jgi:hypothetical protein
MPAFISSALLVSPARHLVNFVIVIFGREFLRFLRTGVANFFYETIFLFKYSG